MNHHVNKLNSEMIPHYSPLIFYHFLPKLSLLPHSSVVGLGILLYYTLHTLCKVVDMSPLYIPAYIPTRQSFYHLCQTLRTGIIWQLT